MKRSKTMGKKKSTHTENVKILTKEESIRLSKEVITSSDAQKEPLPYNCMVMPMCLLDPPEPIKRRKK
jgi:hypothetical protein